MLIHHAFCIGYLMCVKNRLFPNIQSPVLIFCKELLPCEEVVSFCWTHAHESMPVTAESCNSGMPTVTCLKTFWWLHWWWKEYVLCIPSKCRGNEPQLHILKAGTLNCTHSMIIALLHSRHIGGSSFRALSKILHSILSFSSTLMAWSDESAQLQTYETLNCKDAYLCPLCSNLAVFVLEQTPELFNSSHSHSFGTMHMHLWLSKC